MSRALWTDRPGPVTRPPAVAGMFYPADPGELAAWIDGALNRAAAMPVPEGDDPGRVRALVVPHAGYVYSGQTAARGYDLLRRREPDRRPRRVAVLGPTHRVGIRGLALPRADFMATPLGSCPIDPAGLEELAQVRINAATHAEEHSIEVQVPFIQRILGDLPIVPLAVGQAEPQEVAEVIESLVADPQTLIVISSDLSHYHPHDVARRLDDQTIARVLAGDDSIEPDRACGCRPLDGLLHAAPGLGWSAHLLAACTSGDTAGDRSRVVGYASFAFTEEDR